jgi:hypothetical protein
MESHVCDPLEVPTRNGEGVTTRVDAVKHPNAGGDELGPATTPTAKVETHGTCRQLVPGKDTEVAIEKIFNLGGGSTHLIETRPLVPEPTNRFDIHVFHRRSLNEFDVEDNARQTAYAHDARCSSVVVAPSPADVVRLAHRSLRLKD